MTRVQMTTFLQRSLDQGLGRASRRAALNQWWTPQNTNAMQTISVGGRPEFCAADGENIWVSTQGQVLQVQSEPERYWARGRGPPAAWASWQRPAKSLSRASTTPGNLYVIDPTQSPGAVTVASSNLGGESAGIAFDGTNIWSANFSGSVSIITPVSPFTVSTVASGFTHPIGVVYDGAHIWVTDQVADNLFQLDAAGAIIRTVMCRHIPTVPGVRRHQHLGAQLRQ